MESLNAKGSRLSPLGRLDLVALSLSTLCVIHCVALPVLVAIMPLVAQAAENELVHQLLVIAAVPVSLRVIWKTIPMEKNKLFIGTVLAGLALLILAAFIEAVSAYEQAITVAGAALLCCAHLWHLLRRCGKSTSRSLAVESDEA